MLIQNPSAKTAAKHRVADLTSADPDRLKIITPPSIFDRVGVVFTQVGSKKTDYAGAAKIGNRAALVLKG